jgi:hypothetical protein
VGVVGGEEWREDAVLGAPPRRSSLHDAHGDPPPM